MCKVVAYVVTDVIFVISVSLIWYINYQFYYHLNVDTESKTSYPLTSSTHYAASFSSSSSSIVTPTPTVTEGKWVVA